MGAGEPEFHRITFVDKGPDVFAPGSELYNRTLAQFSPSALLRRDLHARDPLLDSLDQPVHQAYLDTLATRGVRPHLTLTWRNAVVVMIDSVLADTLKRLPFIRSIQLVRQANYITLADDDSCKPARLGESATAHQLVNTTPLHDAGIQGQNVPFALIDNGFRWSGMSALQHLQVAHTYDFVQNDSVVWNQEGDVANQDGHGSLTLSVAAGWLQDTMIGMAPRAQYILAKSEDQRYERRIEEDAFCAAIEWAERKGAWVLSASVGYYPFDSTEEAMDYAWMDGRTTFAAQACNRATHLGMHIVVAAGNEGPRERSIILPAEADSVITVGAATSDRTAYAKTSIGPTADGRMKPDLAALGVQVMTQNPEGVLRPVAGTSVAAPQIGGVLALLRQMYPTVPSYTIRNALYASCTVHDSVGKRLGRGIPNATMAARLLGTANGPGYGMHAVVQSNRSRHVYVPIFANGLVAVSMTVFTQNGSDVFIGRALDSIWYEFEIPHELYQADTVVAQIRASTTENTSVYPCRDCVMFISGSADYIPCGVRLPNGAVSVHESKAPYHRLQPRITPNPTCSRMKISIHDVDAHTIRILETSTGAIVFEGTPQSTTEGVVVDLPDLACGHYLLVTTGLTVTATPLIIR